MAVERFKSLKIRLIWELLKKKRVFVKKFVISARLELTIVCIEVLRAHHYSIGPLTKLWQITIYEIKKHFISQVKKLHGIWGLSGTLGATRGHKIDFATISRV